jgi:2-keto-3-deoxy-L-rhamnonate aldolase RhmA
VNAGLMAMLSLSLTPIVICDSEIAAVEGVDVILIGTQDLSTE